MRLDRLITLGLVAPWQRLRGPSTERRLPILMYHSISDDTETGITPYYRACTSPKRFAEQMQVLKASGWRGVTLSAGLTALAAKPKEFPPEATESAERSTPKGQTSGYTREKESSVPAVTSCKNQPKLVAITFDDGFRDFLTDAFPILQRHGFSATMYLPTAYIGNERMSFKSRPCLTWDEVRELGKVGVEFGSHTVNHPKLVNLSWAEIESELRDSKITIEQQLHAQVRSFAYPFAFPQADRAFTSRLRQLLEAAGYTTSATTEIGTVRPGYDPLHLQRLPANDCDDPALFGAKLAGAYDWLALPQNAIKRMRFGLRARGTAN